MIRPWLNRRKRKQPFHLFVKDWKVDQVEPPQYSVNPGGMIHRDFSFRWRYVHGHHGHREAERGEMVPRYPSGANDPIARNKDER